MVRLWPLVVLVGCGRIGFDPVGPVAEGAGPWNQVQTVGNSVDDENPVSTLTLRMAALQAHHLIIVAVQTDHDGNAAPVLVTDPSGCNDYREVVEARAESDAAGGQLQIFHATDSCPGAGEIRVDARALYAVVAWEVSGMRVEHAVDAVGVMNDQPASDAPVGPSIATTAPGDYVVSVVIVDNGVRRASHMGNAFTNDHDTFGNGWAHLTDARSAAGTYQAQWDQPMPGPYCATAVAFFAAE